MNKAESPPPPLPPWLTGKQGKQSRTSRTKAKKPQSINQCSVPGRNFFEVNSDLLDPLIHEPAPPLPP